MELPGETRSISMRTSVIVIRWTPNPEESVLSAIVCGSFYANMYGYKRNHCLSVHRPIIVIGAMCKTHHRTATTSPPPAAQGIGSVSRSSTLCMTRREDNKLMITLESKSIAMIYAFIEMFNDLSFVIIPLFFQFFLSLLPTGSPQAGLGSARRCQSRSWCYLSPKTLLLWFALPPF